MSLQSNLSWGALLDPDAEAAGPLHARLAAALRTAIQRGRLAPGSAVPPSRRLAEDLGCSRSTVTEAYEQLIAEGYLEGRVGSATRVRATSGRPGEPPREREWPASATPRFDLLPGLPDLRAFPRAAWLASLRAVLAEAPYPDLGYGPARGHRRLREVVAAYLNRVRGAAAAADDVTITFGVTDGIATLSRLLGAAGVTAVAVEDPGWTRLRAAVTGAGLAAVPIPIDEQGLRTDQLGARPDVRAVVLSPAHQFPTGVVLSPARRAALVRWANERDALILEDDYDAEFRYDRRPVGTVQGIEPGRVALLGSLSKTLSPALGIGWMVTPPEWTAALREQRARIAAPPVLDQLAFARFLETGGYDRHLRAARARYRTRRDTLVRALAETLPDSRIEGVAAGLHLLVHLDRPFDPARVRTASAAAGVRLDALDAYLDVTPAAVRSLVLGYGNFDDTDTGEAVARLAAVLSAEQGNDRWT